MEEIKVSLILPSLNVARYMDECLLSVISQTLQEIEIICVDAGSTDGTLLIIEKYAKKDERIRILHSPVKSYGYQMNIGIDIARGEYIGIVETDDYVSRDMYRRLYQISAEYNLDLIKSDFFRFKINHGKLEKKLYRITRGKSQYENRIINTTEELACFFFLMNTWCGIYKRNFLRKHNIRHHESLGASFQDNGFFFQTFMYARRSYFLNEPYYMNRRDNPTSSVYNTKKFFEIFQEYSFIRKLLEKDCKLFDNYKYIYVYRCFVSYGAAFRRILKKDRPKFYERFVHEFTDFQKNCMIDLPFVYMNSPSVGKQMEIFLENPKEYYDYLNSKCDNVSGF